VSDATDDLRRQIRDLQATLGAIGSGGVDAVLIGPPGQQQVYTLSSADRPYRLLVENMGEGAATVSAGGVVLFANDRFAVLLGEDRATLVGRSLLSYFGEGHRELLRSLFETRAGETLRAELHLAGAEQKPVPALVSVTGLDIDGELVRCVMVTDLTMQKRVDEQIALNAARELQRAHNQQVAREVNDTIVQGLVAAEMALDLDDPARARELVSRASARARRWISELVDDDALAGGTAFRRTSAPEGGSL
jgi:PAS domain S-box-containing protein